MEYIASIPRTQVMLLPACVEDYVGPENPVRVIEEFVNGLDLAKLKWPQREVGLPGARSFDPRVFLKLFIYGYLNRVRSSRELEKACCRNLEVIWLLSGLRPDHWTINNFRRVHRRQFAAIFREFNLLCGALGLFGADLVAIDGSFFKGVNNKDRNFTKEKLEQLLREIDARTEAYLATLEQAETETADQGLGSAGSEPAPAESPRARVAQWQEKRAELAELLARVTAAGETQISLTDPDSRRLHKPKETVVGYNVQVAVDAAHHLIAAQEVTCDGNDKQQMAPMAEAARAALGVEKLVAALDSGFHSLEQIKRCEALGIEVYVPAPKPARVAGDGTYPESSFRYEAERDCYHCPQGHVLTRKSDTHMTHGCYHVYANYRACRACPVRGECTSGAYRRINVHEDAEIAAAAAARLAQRPEIMGQRMGIVEHVFGTIKGWWNHGAFLTRGLEMVRAEFSLSCLAYNLRRTLNLIPVPQLLSDLRALAAAKAAAVGA